MEPHTTDIMALIAQAPWREAVTYRDTWPHEYVVIKKDRQENLLAAFCERIEQGEGVECKFFGQKRFYLFLGDHKYWTMTDCPDIDLGADDEVLNRALLYRDRRDFIIQPGDTGVREGEPTMTEPEERIEQLDVRTLWKDEALHFTPCLAKNLQLLGDVLGMKLETDQTEAAVGPFSLDIMARDADGIVAIENQLGETDHSHLGQLLTYAAGRGAHTAIWVAPYFVYEHAKALHRLNEWTSGRIRFYGVKVEVVKKGDTDPEPRFLKVVYPGGWNKNITLRPMEIAPIKRQYEEFFKPLITKLLGENFAHKAVQHWDHTGRIFPSRFDEDTGYAISFWKDSAWVTLHLRTWDSVERNNRIFDELRADKEQIESSIEAGPYADWEWNRYDRDTFSSISVRKDGSIGDSHEKLEGTRNGCWTSFPSSSKSSTLA